MEDKWLPEYGPITHAVERVFYGMQRASLANILLGATSEYRGLCKCPSDSTEFDIWRSKWVDVYVACWLLIELTTGLFFCFQASAAPWVALIPIAYRVPDILQASVNLSVITPLRRGPAQYNITNAVRALILTLWTYIELAICFGVIYSSPIADLNGATSWWDPYYFGAVTQLTIGYGDIRPVGLTKLLAPLQGMLGFVLALVAIARPVSFLPQPHEVTSRRK